MNEGEGDSEYLSTNEDADAVIETTGETVRVGVYKLVGYTTATNVTTVKSLIVKPRDGR